MKALKLINISKLYGSIRALDNVSLSVDSNELLCILGPNGSGKTTLLGISVGLIRPSAGRVLVYGMNPIDNSKVLRRIGAVIGNYSIYDWITPERLLKYLSRFRNVDNVDLYLREFGLYDIRKKLVKSLSTGQLTRLAVASALILDPDLIVLDEPFKGIDISFQLKLKEILIDLLRKGKTIVASSNNLIVKDMCTRYIFLDKGRIIAEGTFKDLSKLMPDVITVRARISGDIKEIRRISYVKSIKEVGGIVEVTIPRDKLREFVGFLVSNFSVASISIKELEIEEILRRLVKND